MESKIERRISGGGAGRNLTERLKKSTEKITHGKEIRDVAYGDFDFFDKNRPTT